MEEKELSVSGSPAVYSVTEQPPVSGVGGVMVPHVINTAANASTAVPTAGDVGVVGGGVSSDSVWKKKRGRPRKYDADGNLRVSSKSPSGYGNWKLLACLGGFVNTGGDFTPHVVTVHTGEDVAAKILSFSLKGSRGICVLSANGTVSNVTIRQPGSSGGLLTYEGRFEILSLTGSFTVSENGGVRSRTGGLSVSLAGPDGRIVGGAIAGLLTAASPIQIVLGSFMPNGFKPHKKKHHYQPRSDPDTVTEPTPFSQAGPGASISLTPTSSQLPSQNQNIHNEQNINVASRYTSEWNGSEPVSDKRSYPDINVSVSLE